MLNNFFNNLVVSSVKIIGYFAAGVSGVVVAVSCFYLLPVIAPVLLGYSLYAGFQGRHSPYID